MKYIYLFFLLLTLNFHLYGKLIKQPNLFTLENKEKLYTYRKLNNQDEIFTLETGHYLDSSQYNAGIEYFIPDYLKRAFFAVGTSTSIDLDFFISKRENDGMDLAAPINPNQCYRQGADPYGDICVVNYLQEGKVLLTQSPLITLSLPIIPKNLATHGLYFYPKTKRDFVDKKGGVIFQYLKPVKASFTYDFDAQKVRDFVNNNPNKIDPYQSKCSNPLTYFQDSKFDKLIQKIVPQIQESNLPIKTASQFHTFDEIENYVNELNATLPQENNTVKITLRSLHYLLEGTKIRKETTKDLCLYINYLTKIPEYKSLDKITIVNSQGKPGTIEDLYKFFKKINGYVLDGRYLEFNDKSYFIDWSNDIYDITHECKAIQSHKITSIESKNLLLHKLHNQPRPQYLIFMDDWDNDADDKMDCLRYTSSPNSLAKAELDENDKLIFKDLDMNQIGTIERSDNLIYFDKNSINTFQNSSSFSSYASSSSISFYSSSSYSSSSYHALSSSANHNSTISLSENSGNNSGFSASYNPQTINIDQSSASNSMSNHSTYPSSNLQSLVSRLANHSFDVNGYFAQYDKNDPYGWVYLSSSGKLFAKLDGMDPQTGYLKWTLLQNYFSNVKFENGKIVVGEVKTYPSSNLQSLVSRLANHSFDVNGYFAQYDKNDPYGWVYLSSSGKLFAKLDGMDPQTGYLKWTLLQDYFSNVKFENGKIVVGEVN